MEFENFIKVVKEFEEEDSFADILYLEAIRKLQKVRENPRELDENIARRIIRPFLVNWGRMGRNVERKGFDWGRLIEAIKNQRENLGKLKNETVLCVSFDKVSSVINEIYEATKVKHLGPTGISKILHLLNPELFMMWDDKIRKDITATPFSGNSKGYLNFLKWIQKELIEVTENHTLEEIKDKIGGEYLDKKTLAKLADEYCWRTAHERE
jgi:hypothetical protein